MTLHMRDLVNREIGFEEGFIEGFEEGRALALLQILKKSGSIEQIADFLGIPAQEVADIAKKHGFTLLQYES